jgi:hypothetical protein
MRRLELMSHNLLLRSPRTLWQQALFPEVHFADQQADHTTRAARSPHDFLFAHLPPLHIPQRESAYQMPQMRQGQALAGLEDMLKSANKRVGTSKRLASLLARAVWRFAYAVDFRARTCFKSPLWVALIDPMLMC